MKGRERILKCLPALWFGVGPFGLCALDEFVDFAFLGDIFLFALTSKIVSFATVLILEYNTKSSPVGIPDTFVALANEK